jgi:membrane protein implicated in regulation of membrane protease activity
MKKFDVKFWFGEVLMGFGAIIWLGFLDWKIAICVFLCLFSNNLTMSRNIVERFVDYTFKVKTE